MIPYSERIIIGDIVGSTSSLTRSKVAELLTEYHEDSPILCGAHVGTVHTDGTAGRTIPIHKTCHHMVSIRALNRASKIPYI